jgi:hypothetical protein
MASYAQLPPIDHCLCCGILSGARHLLEQYGPFSLNEKMVWLVGERKPVPKLWVHSDLKVSHAEAVLSESEMCSQLCELLGRMQCPKSEGLRCHSFQKV